MPPKLNKIWKDKGSANFDDNTSCCFFVKTELQHIQLELLVDYVTLLLLIFFSEIINSSKNQWNSNFPNMKSTTYFRLTRDPARKHDSHF